VQQAVQTQAIGIERIGSELAGNLTELVFHRLGNAHIKDPLHEGLDGEQVGVDVLEIVNGLLERIVGRSFLGSGASGSRSRGGLGVGVRSGFLEILKDSTSQGAE